MGRDMYLGIDETQQVTCVMIALHGLPVAFGVSGIGMGCFFGFLWFVGSGKGLVRNLQMLVYFVLYCIQELGRS